MSRAKRQELRERLSRARKRANDLAQQVAATREAKQTGTLGEAVGAQGLPPLPRAPFVARELQPGHMGKVYCVDWAGHHDSEMCSVAQDSKLFIWNAQSALTVGALKMPSSFTMACAMKPDNGALLATGGLQNLVHVFTREGAEDVGESTQTKLELSGHTGYIAGTRFADPDTLVTASGDSTARVWSLKAQSATMVLRGHGEANPRTGNNEGGDVMSVDPCPTDRNLVLTGSIDTLAKVWDLRTGRAVQTYAGHGMDVNAVQFLSCGRAFATGSEDAECRLWDMRACDEVNRFTSHYVLSAVTSLCTSLSGRLLFAGYDDRSCCVWDSLAHDVDRPAHLLQHHERRISSLRLNRTGQAVATGSWDTKIAVRCCLSLGQHGPGPRLTATVPPLAAGPGLRMRRGFAVLHTRRGRDKCREHGVALVQCTSSSRCSA